MCFLFPSASNIHLENIQMSSCDDAQYVRPCHQFGAVQLWHELINRVSLQIYYQKGHEYLLGGCDLCNAQFRASDHRPNHHQLSKTLRNLMSLVVDRPTSYTRISKCSCILMIQQPVENHGYPFSIAARLRSYVGWTAYREEFPDIAYCTTNRSYQVSIVLY